MIKVWLLNPCSILLEKINHKGMNSLKFLTITLFLCGCFNRLPEKTGFEGQPMPIFKLLLTDGISYFNTNNCSNGTPVVMIYVGPRCPFSRAQIQEITKEIKTLRSIQFLIFTTAPYEQTKWLYEEYKLDKFTNIQVGIDYTNTFIDYFKIHSVPYIAIYDGNKKLKYAFEGQAPPSLIKELATN